MSEKPSKIVQLAAVYSLLAKPKEPKEHDTPSETPSLRDTLFDDTRAVLTDDMHVTLPTIAAVVAASAPAFGMGPAQPTMDAQSSAYMQDAEFHGEPMGPERVIVDDFYFSGDRPLPTSTLRFLEDLHDASLSKQDGDAGLVMLAGSLLMAHGGLLDAVNSLNSEDGYKEGEAFALGGIMFCLGSALDNSNRLSYQQGNPESVFHDYDSFINFAAEFISQNVYEGDRVSYLAQAADIANTFGQTGRAELDLRNAIQGHLNTSAMYGNETEVDGYLETLAQLGEDPHQLKLETAWFIAGEVQDRINASPNHRKAYRMWELGTQLATELGDDRLIATFEGLEEGARY